MFNIVKARSQLKFLSQKKGLPWQPFDIYIFLLGLKIQFFVFLFSDGPYNGSEYGIYY